MKREFLFLSLPDDLPEHSGPVKHNHKAASKPNHPPPETSWVPGLQDNGSDSTWQTHNINGMWLVSGLCQVSYLILTSLVFFTRRKGSHPDPWSQNSASCITSTLSCLPSRSECTSPASSPCTGGQATDTARLGTQSTGKALTNAPAALPSTGGMGNQCMISFISVCSHAEVFKGPSRSFGSI